MDIELLRTFLAVSQARHFGRAADQLFLTPAAVSARIRQLEQTLGVTLFHRTRGNIRLTDDGERLLPHAQKLQEAWAHAQRELSLKPHLMPAIRVGCPPGLWFWLEPLLEKLQQVDNIQLTLETCPAREIHNQIVQQRLDFGLLLEPPFHEDLKATLLGEKTLRLFRSEKTAVNAGETGYIQLDWGPLTANLLRGALLPVADRTIYSNDPTFAMGYLQSRPALSWLPVDLAEQAGKALEPVEEAEAINLSVYLAYRLSARDNPLLQMLLEEHEKGSG